MKTVFLSSTARDLSSYREAVYRAVEGLDDFHCVRMENFGAHNWECDAFCRARVTECTLFVGIVGHLYGSCPPESKQSYTEREYEAAVAANVPRLMFIAPEDFPLPANLREPEEKWQRQHAFRERVSQERIRDTFTSSEDLARRVLQAIRNWEQETQVITKPDYFEALASSASDPHTQPFDHSICRSASLTDLNLGKTADFFKRDLVQRQQDYHPGISDQDQMMRFDLLRESHPVYGALLCFGRNPQACLAGALTRCIHWHGDTREGGCGTIKSIAVIC